MRLLWRNVAVECALTAGVLLLAEALAGFVGGVSAQDLVRSPDGLASASSDTATDRVVIVGRASDALGVATGSSEGEVSAADLATRPVFRPGEIMETIPEVIVTQHGGSGKTITTFPACRASRRPASSTATRTRASRANGAGE